MYEYLNIKYIYNIIERLNFVYILKCIKIKNADNRTQNNDKNQNANDNNCQCANKQTLKGRIY